MILKFTVPIPEIKGKIYRRKAKTGVIYVEYEYSRVYNREKKYNTPQRKPIGKVDPSDLSRMFPNENYYLFFPEEEIPEVDDSGRSACLRIGAYSVIRMIVDDYGLEGMLRPIIGKDTGLFLDLAAYSIVCEDNAGQYYPDYAFNHPLFTENMHVYSDSKVSTFLQSLTRDQSIRFMNSWNAVHNHNDRIYISYDSTNKECDAGDIEIVEFTRNAKNNPDGDTVFNYAIGYDVDSREPLFYEDYPGSIVDVSQLRYMLMTVKGFGYQNVGFILDRGYFSEDNIRFMDSEGYPFVIMVKGQKDLVNKLILEVKGTFEDYRSCAIKEYGVYGITIKHKLYESDEKERYFHIFYSSTRNSSERSLLEQKLSRMEKALKKAEYTNYTLTGEYLKYYDPIYSNDKDPVFLGAVERVNVTEAELRLCGYFSIITADEMTAREALLRYKGRDGSEKLFRGDKSYLGNKTERVHSTESIEAKIFVEFVGLIIRNKMYTYLKDELEKSDGNPNYLTVPGAIKELEKIEMVKRTDQVYRMSRAITKTQKKVLKAFNMNARDINKTAAEIAENLGDSPSKSI